MQTSKGRKNEAMLHGVIGHVLTQTVTVTHCAAISKSNVEYVLPSSYLWKAGYCILTQLYSYHSCLHDYQPDAIPRKTMIMRVVAHGYYFFLLTLEGELSSPGLHQYINILIGIWQQLCALLDCRYQCMCSIIIIITLIMWYIIIYNDLKYVAHL